MATLLSGELIFDGNELLEDHAVLIEGDINSRCAPTSEFSGFVGTLVDDIDQVAVQSNHLGVIKGGQCQAFRACRT